MFTTQCIHVHAQFGINKKVPQQDTDNGNDILGGEDAIGFDMNMNMDMNMNTNMDDDFIDFDDPELAEAIELFAGMSPEEMTETIEELKEMFGDDPEMMKEIEEIMNEIAQMDSSEIEQNMKDLMDEEMVAMAMADTLEMLKNADENDWERILENKDAILEAVISAGVVSDSEILHFENDPAAWEEELMLIWKELKSQAAAPS